VIHVIHPIFDPGSPTSRTLEHRDAECVWCLEIRWSLEHRVTEVAMKRFDVRHTLGLYLDGTARNDAVPDRIIQVAVLLDGRVLPLSVVSYPNRVSAIEHAITPGLTALCRSLIAEAYDGLDEEDRVNLEHYETTLTPEEYSHVS
jgi:hypothetical protein